MLQGAKTAFVALVAFCGAAFAIMTFNNDANVTDVFGTLYRLIAGRDAAGPTVLDASYSVGLAAGILLFFNHIASWKITEDPTPIEVEMSLYEENLNKTIIQNGERKGQIWMAFRQLLLIFIGLSAGGVIARRYFCVPGDDRRPAAAGGSDWNEKTDPAL